MSGQDWCFFAVTPPFSMLAQSKRSKNQKRKKKKSFRAKKLCSPKLHIKHTQNYTHHMTPKYFFLQPSLCKPAHHIV